MILGVQAGIGVSSSARPTGFAFNLFRGLWDLAAGSLKERIFGKFCNERLVVHESSSSNSQSHNEYTTSF